jgi:hypothetical protein
VGLCSSCRGHCPGEIKGTHEQAIKTAKLLTCYKGVLLERIAGSTNNVCQIVWNSSATPLLLEQKPFDDGINIQHKEYFMRYVPLTNSTCLSVGFVAGAVIAIVSHERSPLSSTESGANITWTHCPLLQDKNEQIHEVWSVSAKDSNTGTWALIVSSHVPRDLD